MQLNMLCAKDIFHKYIILSTIVYILQCLSVNVEEVIVFKHNKISQNFIPNAHMYI